MIDDNGIRADAFSEDHEVLDGSCSNAPEGRAAAVSTVAGSDNGRRSMGDVESRLPSAAGQAASQGGYFIDGAEAFSAVAVGSWRDISSAPSLQRVVVGASRMTGGAVGGYWWQEEDVTDADGRPERHPTATHWQPRASR